MTIKPWTFFLIAIAGWMNRQQQQVVLAAGRGPE